MKFNLQKWLGKWWQHGLRWRERPGGGWFARRRAAHLRLGTRGEQVAATLLEELGLEIIMRNYTVPDLGELDIVARDGGVLCFVEVKTRHRLGLTRPADAVRGDKRQRLWRTGARYVKELGSPPVPVRYDVVEVILDGWRLQALRHHRNAFAERRWDDPR